MTISAENLYLLNRMNSTAIKTQLGTLLDSSIPALNSVSGTILSKQLFTPTASAATTGASYHRLFAIGDVTGTTAYGMGDPTKPTYGFMASFGRTVAATSSFTGTDVAGNFYMLNKLVNDTAYSIQGMHVKCKNYSTGTVGAMSGLFVECVPEGTSSSASILKLGSDGSAVNNALDMSSATVTNGSDIKLSSGLTIGSGSAAPTHVAAPGSLYIRTGQSDQKAMLYLCTVNDGTWVLLNTVTA